MPLEVLTPIDYGRDRKKFKLKVGQVVADDFFKLSEKQELLAANRLKKTSDKSRDPGGVESKELVDLGPMSVVQIKEFLDEEPELVNLERYLDQESAREISRKSVTQFIERRIRELTGE